MKARCQAKAPGNLYLSLSIYPVKAIWFHYVLAGNYVLPLAGNEHLRKFFIRYAIKIICLYFIVIT